MRTRWLVTLTLSLLPGLFSSGCSSNTPSAPAADGGRGGAESGSSEDVTCGGAKCSLPIGGGIEGLTACCTADGGCGLKLKNIDKCLPRDMPGTLAASECPTPTYKTPGGDSLRACCGANGCGALDSFLGCVPNTELGAPSVSCNYDPTNDCTGLLSVGCDGPEDCSQGKVCCAKFTGAAYTEFGCYDSCDALTDGGTTDRWYEMCHAGDTCQNGSFTCLASLVLPPPFARCDSPTNGGGDPVATADNSAGHVNCGAGTCGDGEKCCMRPPHDPYCAAAGTPCACHPSDAGAK